MPTPPPNPSIDYIFNNTPRRNRFAVFVAVIIALIVGAVTLASAPADSAIDQPTMQPTEGR